MQEILHKGKTYIRIVQVQNEGEKKTPGIVKTVHNMMYLAKINNEMIPVYPSSTNGRFYSTYYADKNKTNKRNRIKLCVRQKTF